MASYKVLWQQGVEKDFKPIPKSYRERILAKVETLSHNPRPSQSKKLQGGNHDYRLRVGEYRVLYRIDDKAQTVTICGVRDRKEAYRHL